MNDNEGSRCVAVDDVVVSVSQRLPPTTQHRDRRNFSARSQICTLWKRVANILVTVNLGPYPKPIPEIMTFNISRRFLSHKVKIANRKRMRRPQQLHIDRGNGRPSLERVSSITKQLMTMMLCRIGRICHGSWLCGDQACEHAPLTTQSEKDKQRA